MDLLRRVLATLGLDCMRGGAASGPQSTSPKRSTSRAGSPDSDSLSSGTARSAEGPRCQSCISYRGHMKRLSCGHTFCDSCTDRIVNEAFLDIEGLCEFPCPMCQSLRQLGFLETVAIQPSARSAPHQPTSAEMLQLEVIEEEEEVVAGD